MRAKRLSLPVLLSCSLALAGLNLVLHPGPAQALSGTPAFTTYVGPSYLQGAADAGEPSVGVNPATGAIFYQAFQSTYKVTVNASGAAAWADVTPPSSITNLDPILATDRATGRTFAGGLDGECSIMSYSDDDGGTWQQMGNACAGVFDHESIGSGPWHGSKPLTATYDRAVYYCAAEIENVCVTSTDGGLTFGAPSPSTGNCKGTHGHLKVSADGTAYLPNKSCFDLIGPTLTGGAMSIDNGTTWTGYTIPGSSIAPVFDPSVATTPDNTVYEAFAGADHHPYVASSSTHAATWSTPVDLGASLNPPIVSSTFQAATAGDNGRVAVAYLGSTTGGDPFAPGWNGVWDLYVSYTYDAGATWTTVKASTDPVQRGYICGAGTNCSGGRNMLDFMDANLTKDGRVVIGYADGCIAACAVAGGTEAQSTSSYATLAYQSSGEGLLAAFDGVDPSPSASASPSPTASPGDPDPSAPTLTNNVAYTATAPALGAFAYTKVLVPAGAVHLTVTLSGPHCPPTSIACTPDYDLYVKAGAKPTANAGGYDGIPGTTSTSNETVLISTPTAGWYYIGVRNGNYTGTASYTVKASFT